MDYNDRQELANHLDLRDWQGLARQITVPEKMIKEIQFQIKGHFPSVNFAEHLFTTYPNERLIDFRDKVKEIGRNDVVQLIESSLEEFLLRKLSEVPFSKLEEPIKRLAVKPTSITKDWKNLAALYNYSQSEIDSIANLVYSCAQKGPTELLMDYLVTSMPWLTINDFGRALEKHGLMNASCKLYNKTRSDIAYE